MSQPIPFSRSRHWRSISVESTASDYTVFEAERRFRHERVAEHALRLAAAFLILAGCVQWFLPGAALAALPLAVRLSLTVLFLATGLLLYLFASRGFRRMIRVDLGQRRVYLARLDSRDSAMLIRHFDLGDVESIFVKRCGSGPGAARLEMRLAGKPGSLPVLAGDGAELEQLHARLCHDVRFALECTPRRVSHNIRAERGTPTRRPERRQRLATAGTA